MRDEIEIMAPAERIYGYASRTERWPQYLPHYRFVRVLERMGDRCVVEMAAWRTFIPVRWRAEQHNDAATPSIHFRHLRGWTKGMEVLWRFDPIPGGTRVSIEHDLDRLDFKHIFIRRIIGDFFIHHIAGKTLRRMKALAEG